MYTTHCQEQGRSGAHPSSSLKREFFYCGCGNTLGKEVIILRGKKEESARVVVLR